MGQVSVRYETLIYLSASGTVTSAQTAFGVSLQNYTHDGQTVQAPSTDASVPNSVGNAILAVGGLDTTKNAAHVGAPIPPPDAFANARPCSIYYGQIAAKYQADFTTKLPKFQGATLPYAPCGYTGPQFRAAYENNSALDGSGVTVASTLWYNSSTIRSDINTYATNHGDGAYARGQFNIVLPQGGFNIVPDCDPSGVQSEQALDTEAMHAMAPSANILYYASASCFDDDLIDTLAKVVRQNKASIVSNSWGEPEEAAGADVIAGFEQVFLRGALQGISFLFSSGDNGDELQNTGLKQADFPDFESECHRRRRDERRDRRSGSVRLPDRLGHAKVRAVRKRQVVDPERLLVRRGRWVLRAVQPSGLPERGRAE